MTQTTIQTGLDRLDPPGFDIAQPKGLAGFLCEVTGEAVSFSECLACAQKGAPGCPMVPAAVHVAANSIRDPLYAQKLAEQAGAEIGFSVTELISCARQTRLKQENPYYEKPSSLYRMNRGTGYHDLLSQYPNGLREETLSWKFKFRGKSILLVGTPDLIELTPEGWLITDYKVTGNAPYGRKVALCGKCEGETYTGEDGLTCRNCGSISIQVDTTRFIARRSLFVSCHTGQLYAF
jgi:hypothetical protein